MKKSALNILYYFTLLGLLSACGEEKPSFSLIPDKNYFQQGSDSFNNKLDILWVIDNSGSMAPYQTNVADNFNAFISGFVQNGYDFQIGVTVSDAWRTPFAGDPLLAKFRDGTDATSHTGVFMINPTTPNLINVFNINVKQGINGVGDERAFQSFKEALNSPLNNGFLRDDSFLAVIIISDEDDFSHPGSNYIFRNYSEPTLDTVNSYVTYLEALTGTTGDSRRFSVSAMAVIDPDCQAQKASTGSIIGQRYIELAGLTDGVTGSLCSQNFANELNEIQNKIAELSTQFFLKRIPIPETIAVRVNGGLIPESSMDGWTYHSQPNSIRFHGSAIPPQGSVIEVDFDPVAIK
jgi:hypothetical protein